MDTQRQNTFCDVKNLAPDIREWLERFLGRGLSDDEQVLVMTYKPGAVPADDLRRRAIEEMNTIVDQAQANAAARGVTPQEADAAAREAMEYVRHRKS